MILLVNPFAGHLPMDSRHGVRRKLSRQSGLKAHLPTVSGHGIKSTSLSRIISLEAFS